MYSRQYLSTSGQKTYTGTKSKCNCLACMKPCGLFFAQRKSPPKWALQLSSFFIRCRPAPPGKSPPVHRRLAMRKKTYQTGNAPPHRGIHHTKNLTSDETRFNALRRCDRGTDAMHLANTPVVSPESKKPKALTSGLNSLCRQSKLWRRYQIYMKYMPFSSVLQDLHLNLSPFVVNVIALPI